MADRLKQIPSRLLELWKQYTGKQRAIILSVIAVVAIAIIILVAVFTRPNMVILHSSENIKEATAILDMLEGSGFDYKLDKDNKTILVNSKNKQAALVLLARSGVDGVYETGISAQDVYNSSMSTTESDKKNKSRFYSEQMISKTINGIEGVKSNYVMISPNTTDYTILSEQEEVGVSIFMTVEPEFQSSTAYGIAEYAATAVGNKTTDSISIIDQNGNILFAGGTDLTDGMQKTEQEFKQTLANQAKASVKSLFLKMGYDDAEIIPNFAYNTDIIKELYTEYSIPGGGDEPMPQDAYNYDTTQANSSGGEPGTGSNGDPTEYLMENPSLSNGNTSISKYNYIYNERITDTIKGRGELIPERSSMSIVLIQNRLITEESLREQGLLDNTTFEQYAEDNRQRTALPEVSEEVYNSVVNATGVSRDNITITLWEQNVFVPTEVATRNISNYLMIVLAILIIALLIFVVFRGTTPVEVTELEPELSVEQLLATTKENQSLDDIEFSDKSETRRMIEKFVDENPEAVAQLLRNWLNEDWE